jgi:hypothetical protein
MHDSKEHLQQIFTLKITHNVNLNCREKVLQITILTPFSQKSAIYLIRITKNNYSLHLNMYILIGHRQSFL